MPGYKPRTAITDVAALRAQLIKNVGSKTGAALISSKFSKDHLFPGHTKKPEVLLASLRSTRLSTLISAEIVANAQKEVKNWIKKAPAGCFQRSAQGEWTVQTRNNTCAATGAYKIATVDLAARRGMDKDDLAKKARKWMTIGTKVPQVACTLGADGVPQIYHLDF